MGTQAELTVARTAEHGARLAARRRLEGVALIALSAACFGMMAIFTRFAYASGADLYGVLLPRFILAFIVLALLMRLQGIRWPAGRQLVSLALMGGGYVAQAWFFFSALAHAQASLVALLLYLYPSFVVVLAALFLHERIDGARLLALALCSAGTLLTVGGGHGSALGIAFAVMSALIYAVYITAGMRITRGVHPVAATAVICGASCVLFGAIIAVRHALGAAAHYPVGLLPWMAVGAVALVSTVISVLCFFAGLQRLGAAQASMLSTLEPVVTVVLAWALLGETMAPTQMAGGVLILIAVLWLAMPRTARQV